MKKDDIKIGALNLMVRRSSIGVGDLIDQLSGEFQKGLIIGRVPGYSVCTKVLDGLVEVGHAKRREFLGYPYYEITNQGREANQRIVERRKPSSSLTHH